MTLKSKAFIAAAAALVAAIGIGVAIDVWPSPVPSDGAAPSTPPLVAREPGLLPGRPALAAVPAGASPAAAMAEATPAPAEASPATAEIAVVAIEVVNARGERVHEGTVQLSTTGLEGATLLSKISQDMDRYGWFFEHYELAKGNPIEIREIPREFWDRCLHAEATVPTYAPSAAVILALEAGKTAHARLEVVPGRRVEFDVRNAADGRPIRDARVFSMTEAMRRGISPEAVEAREGTGWATTAADGRCTVEELGPGSHRVEVLAEGYRTGRLDVQEADAGPVSVRLEAAHDTGVLEVLVSDPDGRPAAGIRVHLNTSTQLVPLVAATDAVGIARFTGIAPGLQVLSLQGEDWVRRSRDAGWVTDRHQELMTWAEIAEGETRRLDLGYPRATGVLACDVVDLDGKPLAGVSVRLYGPMMRDGKTDERGRTTFDGLVSGAYQTGLRGTPDWFDAKPRTLADGARIEVRRVAGSRTISGVVRAAADGHPAVPGVHVSVTGDCLAGSPARADGSFAIGGAVPGHYQVEVSADGYPNAKAEVDVALDADAAVPEILLRRGGRVFLDVLPADRPAFEGTRLRLRTPDGTEIDLRPDVAGSHYRFTSLLPAGRYALEVLRGESDRTERPVQVREGEDSVVTLAAR